MKATKEKTEAVGSRKAIVESLKLLFRIILLVGVPAILAEIIRSRPEWGGVLGIILLIVDKFVHENPNINARGISPI